MSGNEDALPSGGLTQGDSSEYYNCEVCDNLTLNEPIMLRAKGEGIDGSATQLRACDKCQMNLACIDWRKYIDE